MRTERDAEQLILQGLVRLGALQVLTRAWSEMSSCVADLVQSHRVVGFLSKMDSGRSAMLWAATKRIFS